MDIGKIRFMNVPSFGPTDPIFEPPHAYIFNNAISADNPFIKDQHAKDLVKIYVDQDLSTQMLANMFVSMAKNPIRLKGEGGNINDLANIAYTVSGSLPDRKRYEFIYFLGVAILETATASWAFRKFPELSHGSKQQTSGATTELQYHVHGTLTFSSFIGELCRRNLIHRETLKDAVLRTIESPYYLEQLICAGRMIICAGYAFWVEYGADPYRLESEVRFLLSPLNTAGAHIQAHGTPTIMNPQWLETGTETQSSISSGVIVNTAGAHTATQLSISSGVVVSHITQIIDTLVLGVNPEAGEQIAAITHGFLSLWGNQDLSERCPVSKLDLWSLRL